MQLDPSTLIVINVANLLAMTMALPLVLGQNPSPAARDARLALMVNGAAWLALFLAGYWRGHWPDWALSTLSMALLGASNWLVFRALTGWLGPRPHGLLLKILVLAMPAGYALSFHDYQARVGWANLLLAAQLLVLARATLLPQRPDFGRPAWRYLMLGCFTVMAVFTALRGILGAWFTELYPFFRAPTPVNIGSLVAANVTLVLGNIAVLAAWREEADLRLRTMVMTDPLTGLLNRNGWVEQSERAMRHAQRTAEPLSLLMIDLDFFKIINDTRGHETGDAALRLFGHLLRHHQRAGDVSARLGGEEFCVLLAQADAQAAQTYDRRLRAQLVATAPAQLQLALDFSSGHALYNPASDTLASLMARADDALYRAKHAGRGQLVLTDSDAFPS